MSNICIPNVVHHIAPEDQSKWHPIWEKCRNSFIKNFPNHKFILWNDQDDIDRLIYDHYKEMWNLYKNFPHHIMKIDFARLCILHKNGGIYADMDFYCYKNFENYLNKENLFIENTSNLYTNSTYENCLMASQSNSEFLHTVIRNSKYSFIVHRNFFNLHTKNWRSYENDYAVNNTTGSGMLSACIEKYGQYFSIGKFPADFFNQDPIIYKQDLIGRHLHSSLWGEDYIDHKNKECFMIKEGNIWNCSSEFLETETTARRWEQFDFYRNYNDLKNNSPDSADK
jgi:hypothetical protein